MRLRLGGLVLFASVLTAAASSCVTAGVSAIYMSIDTGGAQRRTVFYTDSSAIYCVAKFSSARQDATLDFTIKQNEIFPWCQALNNPIKGDPATSDVYNIFAIGEQTPGVGTETVVAEELLPNGVGASLQCSGYIAPNLPAGNICSGGGTGANAGTLSAACEAGYESEGADSAGPGFTCCANLVNTGSSTMAPSVIPYPAGSYTCTVSLDGVVAGSTDFEVQYPTFPNGSCPSPRISNHSGSVKNALCYCPAPPPFSGVPCYNWVPQGAACPAEDTDVVCVCNGNGVWECVD